MGDQNQKESTGQFDWASLVRQVDDFILVVDELGKILYINHISPNLSHEAVMALSVYDYSAPEYHTQFREKLIRVLETGKSDRIELKCSAEYTSGPWWSVSISRVCAADDTTRMALLLCRDVTNLENVRRAAQKAVDELSDKYFREFSAHFRARELLVEEIAERRRIEASLRTSESRYRSLVENSNNAIIAIDQEGIFQFLNPIAAASLGGAPEDFVGSPMVNYFPKEFADRQLETIQRVIRVRKAELHQLPTYIGGRVRWYKTSIQPLLDDNDRCTMVLLEATDIDEQIRTTQQLDREKQFCDLLLRTANCLIVALDSKARIKVFNSECENVTGYKFEEVVNEYWYELFLPIEKHHDGLKNFDEWVRQHPQDKYEGPLLTKSGGVRSILWSNSSFMLQNPQELVAIAIGVDITDLKAIQRELEDEAAKLRAVNTTFDVLSENQRKREEELKSAVLANYEKKVIPILERIKKRAPSECANELGELEDALRNATSPYIRNLLGDFAALTNNEIRVCDYILKGYRSKEIAEALGVSVRTIDKIRQNIRRKLGLTDEKTSLLTFLKRRMK